MNKIRILSTVAFATLTCVASAQINYVDAAPDGVSTGNTAVAPSYGGGAFTPFVGQTWAANDGVWDMRAFGNAASIFQNSAAGQIDTNAVRLATSATGLASDTYDAYVYFWTDSSTTWQIGASLTDSAGQLTLFKVGDANVTQFYAGYDNLASPVYSTSLAVNPFTSSVMVAEGNRRLVQAHLGSFTGTGLDVYVEVNRAQLDQNQRTWYDGIGYSIVPEPSSFALFGGCLFAFLARRKFSL